MLLLKISHQLTYERPSAIFVDTYRLLPSSQDTAATCIFASSLNEPLLKASPSSSNETHLSTEDFYHPSQVTETINQEPIERPMTSSSRKNVSFNSEIDVRVFAKNSKNPKIFESYLRPLTVQSPNQTKVVNSSLTFDPRQNTGDFSHIIK